MIIENSLFKNWKHEAKSILSNYTKIFTKFLKTCLLVYTLSQVLPTFDMKGILINKILLFPDSVIIVKAKMWFEFSYTPYFTLKFPSTLFSKVLSEIETTFYSISLFESS